MVGFSTRVPGFGDFSKDAKCKLYPFQSICHDDLANIAYDRFVTPDHVVEKRDLAKPPTT